MTTSTRNRHLKWDVEMFQLIVADFENTVRGEDRISQYGKRFSGGEFNWEFLETMKELFVDG